MLAPPVPLASQAPLSAPQSPIDPIPRVRPRPVDDTGALSTCLAWRSGELLGVRIGRAGRAAHVACLTREVRVLASCADQTVSELFVDAAALNVGVLADPLAAIGTALRALVDQLGPALQRVAVLAPNDWTTPWWHGLALLAGASPSWRTFTTRAEVGQWLRAGASDPETLGPDLVRRSDPLLSTLEDAIRALPGADLRHISRQLGLSTRSLQRALERQGLAFHQLRTRIRLERAEALLAARDTKISAIGGDVGFASPGHFIRWFRAHRGVTPGAWRAHRASASASSQSS